MTMSFYIPILFMIVLFIFWLVDDCVTHPSIGSRSCRSYFNWFDHVQILIGLWSCLYLNWFMAMSSIFQLIYDSIAYISIGSYCCCCCLYFDWLMIMPFLLWLVYDHVVYISIGIWSCRSYFSWFTMMSFILIDLWS